MVQEEIPILKTIELEVKPVQLKKLKTVSIWLVTISFHLLDFSGRQTRLYSVCSH